LNLEFFEDGYEGTPMLLLHGGAPEEVVLVRHALQPLCRSIGPQLDLGDLPFVADIRAIEGDIVPMQAGGDRGEQPEVTRSAGMQQLSADISC
jgi:hypothetical protein